MEEGKIKSMCCRLYPKPSECDVNFSAIFDLMIYVLLIRRIKKRRDIITVARMSECCQSLL